jgi:hypothetical protein
MAAMFLGSGSGKKQNRLESMEEMVRDFLVKQGC